jgi:hypothetical protein
MAPGSGPAPLSTVSKSFWHPPGAFFKPPLMRAAAAAPPLLKIPLGFAKHLFAN